MNQLNVPWDKIRASVEAGVSMSQVADLYNIKMGTIKARSLRGKWDTPVRRANVLKEALAKQGDRVTGSQGNMAKLNASLTEQLNRSATPKNPKSASTPVDFDAATKEYRNKGVEKMAMLLDAAILSPPRNYKDLDIADKIMRRLLGIDDNEGKSSTIVSLQLVNERLQESLQSEIIEGDFEAESVRQVSDGEALQSNSTGMGSASDRDES